MNTTLSLLRQHRACTAAHAYAVAHAASLVRARLLEAAE